MVKKLSKTGVEGKYNNIKNAICDKPSANIIINGEKLETFPVKSGTRQGCELSPTLTQHSTGSPTQKIRQGKQIKRIQMEIKK